MSFTRDTLAEFITSKTQEHWDENQSPYLLAHVAPIILKEDPEYKNILSPQSLKQFIGNYSSKLKIIQHPTQRAKVGVIPASENFTYPAESQEPDPSSDSSSIPTRQSRRLTPRPGKFVVIDFLEALSHLEKEEMDQIIIPTSILVKLTCKK